MMSWKAGHTPAKSKLSRAQRQLLADVRCSIILLSFHIPIQLRTSSCHDRAKWPMAQHHKFCKAQDDQTSSSSISQAVLTTKLCVRSTEVEKYQGRAGSIRTYVRMGTNECNANAHASRRCASKAALHCTAAPIENASKQAS
ncbi:Os05g0441150 [Oryza sativa Japonica Group]|jgi:hypothetical protein|uniref:Os05g0441150 protein n=1 Tax=Oryza sativa subsp. japonica TaxID=39947 RepID=A0A0P0WN06_ORYSJ|nr:Os05g0441150 [Oryza sativa Japonica Group]